ncbi:hypothetical protein BDN67DRAFT_752759 [Paxillus ammoniavirescens]|nr:hypothetical protein BDN67DRAFT_752759 [Paxillus ammoniavirescens]
MLLINEVDWPNVVQFELWSSSKKVAALIAGAEGCARAWWPRGWTVAKIDAVDAQACMGPSAGRDRLCSLPSYHRKALYVLNWGALCKANARSQPRATHMQICRCVERVSTQAAPPMVAQHSPLRQSTLTPFTAHAPTARVSLNIHSIKTTFH